MSDKNKDEDIFAPYVDIFGWKDETKNNSQYGTVIGVSQPDKKVNYSASKSLESSQKKYKLKSYNIKKYQECKNIRRKKVFLSTIAGIGAIALVGSLFSIGFKGNNYKEDEDELESSVVSIPVKEYEDETYVKQERSNDEVVLSTYNDTESLESVVEVPVEQEKTDNIEESIIEDIFVDEDSIEVYSQDESNGIDELNEEIEESVEEEVNKTIDKSNDEIIEDKVFDVGTNSVEETIDILDNTYAGYFIKHYCEVYGMDPNLIAAMCFQESSGIQNIYGAATGIMQLENQDDYEIEVYNYAEQRVETILISSQYADDLDYNIHCAVALMKDNIEHFNGNIYAGLQGYNFSKYMVDYIMSVNGIVLDGYADCNWTWYMSDASDNPWKYGQNGTSYGDGNYIRNVLSHCPTDIITYKYKDKEIEVNIATGSVVSVNDTEYTNEMTR